MKIKRYTIRDFKARARKGDVGNCCLPKAFHAEVKQVGPETDRTLSFIASTGSVDRDGDTINPKGWELENFQKGGTILWAHMGRQPPIAKPVKLWKHGGALKMHAQFSSVYPFADLIYRLYQEGTMRAVSVGFIPKEFEFDEERKDPYGWPAVNFLKQELLEVSAVPVPANAEALHEAAKGIDCAPLLDFCEKTLDGGENLWVPKEWIEDTYRALKGDFTSVDFGDIEVDGLADDPAATDDAPADDKGADDAVEKLTVTTDSAATPSNHTHTVSFPEDTIPMGEYFTSENAGHTHSISIFQVVEVGETRELITSEHSDHVHKLTVSPKRARNDGGVGAGADDPEDTAVDPSDEGDPADVEGKGSAGADDNSDAGDTAPNPATATDIVKSFEDQRRALEVAETEVVTIIAESVSALASGIPLTDASKATLTETLKTLTTLVGPPPATAAEDDEFEIDDGEGKEPGADADDDDETFELEGIDSLEEFAAELAGIINREVITPLTGKVH